MFAGAAFTDESDFAVEANVVNTLVGLGVIDGYDDGSFRPEATVTRAEMAKMIYVIRTGKSDASAYNNDATTFTDITDHWAKGYIKYCQSMGIIAGKSTTSFDPDATVTTQEAAKMLLVTLGYNAEKAGLEGTGWGAKTTALADENGLLKDVNNGTTQGLPRQYAAQLMYNTIFANTVALRDGEYSKYGYDNSLNPTVGAKYMDLIEHDGMMIDIGYNDAKSEYIYTIDGATTKSFSTTADYSDLFGMYVNVLYKNVNDKVVVYGIYEYKSDVLAEGVLGNIDDFGTITGSTTEITISDVDYKVSNVKVYDFNNDTAVSAATVAGRDGYKAFSFKAIDNNEDNKIDAIVVAPVVVEQVTFVNSTKFGLTGSTYNSVDLEDAHTYDGMAKDDWVVVTAAANAADGTMKVEKATMVTGTIDGKKTDTGIDSILVDGTWYEEATASVITQSNGSTVEMAVIGTIVFNCDTTSANVATSDVVFVEQIAVESTASGLDQGDKLMAKIIKADGTIVKAQVSKIDDKEVICSGSPASDEVLVNTDETYGTTASPSYAGKLYSYAMDGDKYELTLIHGPAQADLAGYDAQTSGSVSFDKDEATLGNFNIADDAVIFVKSSNEDDTKVYTGKTLKTWSDTSFADSYVLALDETSKFQTVAVAALDLRADLPASGDTIYGYITAAPYTSKVDSTNYVNLSIWTVDGQKDYIVKADSNSNALAKGDMIAFNMKSDNEIKLDTSFTTETGAVVAATSSRVEIKNVGEPSSTVYKITEDTVIVYVDGEEVVGIEGGSVGLAIAKDSRNNYANVKYKYNNSTDKEIEVIYVATNGYFGTATSAPVVAK